jgi:hypothetical protein
MITIEDFTRREVHYCASSLVHTLANNPLPVVSQGGSDLESLMEAASELTYPVQDYDDAAIDAGWTFQPYSDDSAAKDVEPGYWWRMDKDGDGNDDDETEKRGFPCLTADTAELACQHDDVEPHDREIYEHWIVSDWLADRLEERGERVDKDFAGLTIWGRTTTGQAIFLDAVIQDIYSEMIRA